VEPLVRESSKKYWVPELKETIFPNSNEPVASAPPNSPPEESMSQIEFDEV
jgi:hypothetical protein